MTESQMTIIEVNGVKLEVDLRTAKRIDQLKVGSRVKCLIKTYSDFKTVPGIVVGFEPFKQRPTIVVCYLETDYNSASLKFVSFNQDTKDFEIVADIDNNALEVNKADVLSKMDREIEKKKLELAEVEHRKEFFLKNFNSYFQQATV